VRYTFGKRTGLKCKKDSLVKKMLTGLWELDLDQTTTQAPVLRLMGRPNWQISVIDKAKERFRLIHYKSDKGVHFVHKHVHLHLDSVILAWLSKLAFGKIPFDQVTYSHWLYANNAEKNHDDDEKRFGPCQSVTSWEEDGPRTLTIRWKLPRGLLHVTHQVTDKDHLKVELTFTEKKRPGHDKPQIATATKIYRRLPFTKADEEFIAGNVATAPMVQRS